MGLFYFVEQHDGVGLAPYRFGQLTAFFIAHISGRRAYKTGDGKLLHIFGHIYSYQIVFVVEKTLCKRLCKLRLADSRRTEKHKGAYRSVGVRNACA